MASCPPGRFWPTRAHGRGQTDASGPSGEQPRIRRQRARMRSETGRMAWAASTLHTGSPMLMNLHGKGLLLLRIVCCHMNPVEETNLSRELVGNKARVYRFSVVIEKA